MIGTITSSTPNNRDAIADIIVVMEADVDDDDDDDGGDEAAINSVTMCNNGTLRGTPCHLHAFMPF